ncbi:uroporphyrinogen-III C-methyltransferase [Phenylobacterium immobile]|uniref:uroporphyrinogen-III C-methyltransferase n=1 Tax=Phenylobacterium immobile TaxID=21 RepID=UPI000A51B11A|nr:uroporphyrinogen-III C-methyltransferase [Phenylobacterium immobile]
MPHEPGRVLLVGAGPGPVDLMTVRAARAVAGADALLYDALTSPEVLELAPARCLRIQTGKRAGRASMRQETINRLMLRLARRGLTVVRLKGGDPSIFGRVGEEKAFLAAHGVSAEIIPGVTAASAAAAQFGFPLTHRGQARRLLIATASLADGALPAGGWVEAADPETTLALYMGRDRAAEAAMRLISAGRAAHTPVLAVENAGAPHARPIASTLAALGVDLAAADVQGPVVIIVGETTAQAQLTSEVRMNDVTLFDFERDFVDSLRCVPMAVRFKLDLAEVKLSLRQWSRFTVADRRGLLLEPCDAPAEISAYRAGLIALIAERVGEAAKPLPEPACDLWRHPAATPAAVAHMAVDAGLPAPTPLQWAALSPLQRFALLKLTRAGHDNVNFIPALKEFGLAPFAWGAGRRLRRTA